MKLAREWALELMNELTGYNDGDCATIKYGNNVPKYNRDATCYIYNGRYRRSKQLEAHNIIQDFLIDKLKDLERLHKEEVEEILD